MSRYGRGRDVLRRGGEGVLVAPSVLSADFCELGAECEDVLGAVESGGAGADLLHVDVMDGHFVPNVSMGPAVAASLRSRFPEVCLDVHLMVTDPGQYIGLFADAGADHLTFHAEPAMDPRAGGGKSPLSEGYDALELAGEVREAGMGVGLGLNPGTDVGSVDRLLGGDGSGTGGWGAFDLVLVMSVWPGFSGQSFIEGALETARAVRGWLPADRRVEMDGGVGPKNAAAVRGAGADVLVSASAVFGVERGSRAGVVSALRGV